MTLAAKLLLSLCAAAAAANLAPAYAADPPAREAPVTYDRQLAAELAVAFVHADFRQRPDMALPGVRFQSPVVTAGRAAKNRAYVFVTFASAKGTEGAFVTFQICGPISRLVVAESGTTDNIASQRADNARIDANTRVAYKDLCPKSGI